MSLEISHFDKEIIKNLLLQRVSPYLIIVFGSYAKGNAGVYSDVDIAFLSDEEHGDYFVFMTAQELAGLLGREVDLVDLKKASTVFQAQVVGKGTVVHSTDEKKRMLFCLTVLKKYAKLNEERRCILEKLAERGSIYG
ncbi:hypothetical protein DCCM_4667 [Desulfocucumis palustris]|uniref:Polymerase beta nucleotidyltransferase domain-containing protein n=1 Tax=Desulfocucumis palustris TaxID=1898651 RepID=A0A2L2XH26_9FIRM|nr:nucleotidyltransferase domain-containing protein [Desulfocucumis palustris]GBF35538.1 hypothetical protein DCCM_4667 [Desulfocucumis palustris]